MTVLSAVEHGLQLLSPVLSGVLLIRLLRDNLISTYSYLGVLLAIDAIRSVALIVQPRNYSRYAVVFIISEVIIAVLWFLTVRQLLDRSLRNYRGLAALGQKVLLGGLIVATLLSVATAGLEGNVPGASLPLLEMMFSFERALFSALVLLLLFCLGFVAWLAIVPPRNVNHLMVGCSILFLAKVTTLMLRNLAGHQATRMASTLNLAIACACVGWWAFAVSRSGEEERPPPEQAEVDSAVGRYLQSLDAMLDRSRKAR